MSARSTGGALAAASFCAIVLALSFWSPARKDGLAYESPFSSLQSLATRPKNDAAIMARKKATTARDTMPTASWRRRRQASVQRPGDSWRGAAGGLVSTALMADSAIGSPSARG